MNQPTQTLTRHQAQNLLFTMRKNAEDFARIVRSFEQAERDVAGALADSTLTNQDVQPLLKACARTLLVITEANRHLLGVQARQAQEMYDQMRQQLAAAGLIFAAEEPTN